MAKSKLFFYCFFSLFIFFGMAKSAFADNSPVIFYTDIISGPNTGGENNNGCYLTIFGKNFGNLRGTSVVTIGGGEVSAYKTWSDTKVSVQLGSAVSDGNIILATNKGSMTGPDSFDVRASDIYFISLTGNNSTGIVNDINHPYRTPNYVHDLAGFGAGDFIYVRGGTFDLDNGLEGAESSRWLNAEKDGSAENPITFSGYPGEDAIIQIDNSGYSAWCQPSSQLNRYYWVIANFNTVINSATGIPWRIGWSSSDMRKVYNFRLVNFDIQGGGNAESGASPFEIGRIQDGKIFGVNIHNSAQTGPSRTHFIYLGGEDITNLEVGWCQIHDCNYGRAAFQVHADGVWEETEKIDEVYIHNCLIYNVPSQAFLVDGRTEDIYFYNNIIYSANQNSQYAASVISLRGDGDTDHGNIRLFNNTVYGNGGESNSGILEMGLANSDSPGQVKFFNNIFYLTDNLEPYAMSSYIDSISSDYNCWHGSDGNVPVWEGSNKVVSNPIFLDPSLNNFQLQSTSPAVNAGSSSISLVVQKDFLGLSRPQGSGYDIGAFEYDENTAVDTVAPNAPAGLSVR